MYIASPFFNAGSNEILPRERIGRSYSHSKSSSSSSYGYNPQRRCGKPGQLANGVSKFSGVSVGSKVLHSCNAGYLLVGAKLRICQNNGRWTPSIPHCKCKFFHLNVTIKPLHSAIPTYIPTVQWAL